MIHPTAIISPGARLDPTVEVGPYAVIDAAVVIGPGCVIGPHVYITGATAIGPGNRFYAGCVIGEAPQDLHYAGQPTGVEIGAGNVFREHVTIHRSSTETPTRLGSDNFLMANAHVGHNCRIGNHVIIANGTLLGGHVEVQDRAFISGNCLVHQFSRVGSLAMMQGGTAVSKDVPPFTIAYSDNKICGLNTVGLRRAGFKPEDRLRLRELYHQLFRAKLPLGVAVKKAMNEFKEGAPLQMLEFLASSKRGACGDARRRHRGLEVEVEPSEAAAV